MDDLQIHVVESLPFNENTYVVFLENRDDCLVIDPGMEPELILRLLEELDRRPAAILNTHGHGDHIAGNEAMKEAFPDAPLMIGVNEAHLLTDANANLTGLFGMPITSPSADRLLKEGEVVEAAGIRLEVLEVPGHSPGHVVFVWRGTPSRVFGGDVLFERGIGRSDFPGCNGPLLLKGIRAKLFALPPETVVYPGHGSTTTIGAERAHNPFVGDNVRG
ncbi:MAG TPA: MBL fold metallo-hydrolase [Gemmataceae bacterium]|nr:MBL fold metallo-hydrolase [Gemmataceae bacterium]